MSHLFNDDFYFLLYFIILFTFSFRNMSYHRMTIDSYFQNYYSTNSLNTNPAGYLETCNLLCKNLRKVIFIIRGPSKNLNLSLFSNKKFIKYIIVPDIDMFCLQSAMRKISIKARYRFVCLRPLL